MSDSCANQNRSLRLRAAAFALAWLLGTGFCAFAQTAVGTISQLAGAPQVARGGHAAAVTQGMAVLLLDQYTTDGSSSLTATFDDGSSVELGENSELVIDEHVASAGKTRLSLLGGRLIALVNKGLRAGSGATDFAIQTPNAFLAVRGTKFKVKYADSSALYDGPSTEVAVMQGTVTAANRAAPNQTVEVSAGYETVILGTQPPLPPGPIGLAGMGGGRSKGFPGVGPGGAAPPPPPPPPAAPPPLSPG